MIRKNLFALAAADLVIGIATLHPSTAIAQNLPVERQVSIAVAHDIAMAAMEQCRKDGFKVAVTVVDRGGRMKAMIRDDGTGPHTIEASERKAYTASAFRVPTATFAERVSQPA